MKNSLIRHKWDEFISDLLYKDYFLTKEDYWYNKLEECKKYIIENKKIPSQISSIENIKILGAWLNTQRVNYKKKVEIMKDCLIRNKWEEFINDVLYKDYLLTRNEKWVYKLDECKKYINENKKRPNKRSSDLKEKIIGKWLSHQVTNYNTKIHMDDIIRKLWEEFITDEKYIQYFKK